jgi:hypothetical protein
MKNNSLETPIGFQARDTGTTKIHFKSKSFPMRGWFVGCIKIQEIDVKDNTKVLKQLPLVLH